MDTLLSRLKGVIVTMYCANCHSEVETRERDGKLLCVHCGAIVKWLRYY